MDFAAASHLQAPSLLSPPISAHRVPSVPSFVCTDTAPLSPHSVWLHPSQPLRPEVGAHALRPNTMRSTVFMCPFGPSRYATPSRLAAPAIARATRASAGHINTAYCRNASLSTLRPCHATCYERPGGAPGLRFSGVPRHGRVTWSQLPCHASSAQALRNRGTATALQ